MQAEPRYGHRQQHLRLALYHFAADSAEACCRGPFWLMQYPCGPLLPVGDDFMGIYDWEVCTLLQLKMPAATIQSMLVLQYNGDGLFTTPCMKGLQYNGDRCD